jgi:hypothetical protein
LVRFLPWGEWVGSAYSVEMECKSYSLHKTTYMRFNHLDAYDQDWVLSMAYNRKYTKKKKSGKLSSSTSWPLKMGTIGCPKMLVWNYHSTLCEIPDEHRFQCGKTIWWIHKDIT